MSQFCAICRLHQDAGLRERYEIHRSDRWVLRHHPDPAPLPGWLMLDSLRHCSGPIDFQPEEAAEWGIKVCDASAMVKRLTGCDRVYSIGFGEGAQHLHLHLIPRFVDDPRTTAWSVADHYRAVSEGRQAAADTSDVQEIVQKARDFTMLK